MKRVKKMTYCGDVLEAEVFYVREGTRAKDAKPPRRRFESEKEREQHRIGIARRHFIRKFNANFNDECLYSTLTFDDAHEVHTYEEMARIRDKFYKDLKKINTDAKIVMVVGRGKTGGRWHLHMISDGISKKEIDRAWGYGDVRKTETLRRHNYYGSEKVDHGRDYTGLAVYLFNHWTPEQSNHYYKASKNFVLPESEPATDIQKCYDEKTAPRAPKGYGLVEVFKTDFGYYRYIYVREPENPTKPQLLAWLNRRIIVNWEDGCGICEAEGEE